VSYVSVFDSQLLSAIQRHALRHKMAVAVQRILCPIWLTPGKPRAPGCLA